LLSVKHIQINAYNPSENGQVERKNKTIADFIRKLCNENQENWDKFVRLAAFEYNCSPHIITKKIPFYLEQGFYPRLEIDQILKTAINQNDAMNLNLWTRELLPKIKTAIQEASKKIKAERDKNSFKAKFIRRLFTEGDLVRIKNYPKTNLDMGITAKLENKWKGPFKITEVPKNFKNSYIVKSINNDDPIMVDMSNVTKWIERPDWMNQTKRIQILDKPHTLEEISESTEEEESTVVKHRKPSEVEDSSRPVIEIKKKNKKKTQFRKESDTDTYKKGTKVDVLVLDEQHGRMWLCARIMNPAGTKNSVDRFKVKILSNSRMTFKRPHEIRICVHETVCQVGSMKLSDPTYIDSLSFVTNLRPESCQNSGEEPRRNNETPTWSDGVLRNPCNNNIPFNSLQEAIGDDSRNSSSEVVMLINGQKFVLNLKSVCNLK
jgi:hypothetical protein